MARKQKTNIRNGIDKREVGYYSTPAFVAGFLAKEMLALNPNGLRVLDPAVGNEELLEVMSAAGKQVDGYDIVRYKERYDKCRFFNLDFIQEFFRNKEILRNRRYDYIIMNPPYNCHEHSYIAENKEILKRHFDIGVLNLYALFLSAVIDIAPAGGLIGAILPDSFLSAAFYDKLRKKILQDCSILQLHLCPDDLFHRQGANTSTCILILRKGNDFSGKIIVSGRPKNSQNLKRILAKRLFSEKPLSGIIIDIPGQPQIFAIDCPAEIRELFQSCPQLGKIYHCGGGISTGCDSKYTSKSESEEYCIPFFQNSASNRFHTRPNSYLSKTFLEQSRRVSNFIVRNADYLDKEGIVCSSIGKHFAAAYLPIEGVTGVNAAIWPPSEDINWLLAYLNSSLATYLLKGILSRGNITTIGSVFSLPMIDLSPASKRTLGNIASDARNSMISPEEAVTKIDRIIYRHLKWPIPVRHQIAQFCADLTHLV